MKLESSDLIKIKPYEAISDYLSQLKNQTIWLSKHTSQAIIEFCSQNNNKLLIECSPVSLTKAIKNEVEIQGFINCHIKDAAALCSYFAWLEKEVPKGETEWKGCLYFRYVPFFDNNSPSPKPHKKRTTSVAYL